MFVSVKPQKALPSAEEIQVNRCMEGKSEIWQDIKGKMESDATADRGGSVRGHETCISYPPLDAK